MDGIAIRRSECANRKLFFQAYTIRGVMVSTAAGFQMKTGVIRSHRYQSNADVFLTVCFFKVTGFMAISICGWLLLSGTIN